MMQTYHFDEVVNDEGVVMLSGLPALAKVAIVVVYPEPQDIQQEMKQLMHAIRQDHPFMNMSKEEILLKLRQTREEVCEELYGGMYED
jgi:uncharacterized protein (DUF885 family)